MYFGIFVSAYLVLMVTGIGKINIFFKYNNFEIDFVVDGQYYECKYKELSKDDMEKISKDKGTYCFCFTKDSERFLFVFTSKQTTKNQN